jgi:hypothetical protein
MFAILVRRVRLLDVHVRIQCVHVLDVCVRIQRVRYAYLVVSKITYI